MLDLVIVAWEREENDSGKLLRLADDLYDIALDHPFLFSHDKVIKILRMGRTLTNDGVTYNVPMRASTLFDGALIKQNDG